MNTDDEKSRRDEPADESARRIALRRGIDFLVGAQADGGGWHSGTYGALRGGASLTSLALNALAHAPPDMRESLERPLSRAVDFLRRGLARRRTIACPDGTLEYPVYATALVLDAERRRPLGWTADERLVLIDYLIASQLTEVRGWPETHIEHGGWDVVGDPNSRGPSTGTNVSLVRHALEGLLVVVPIPRDAPGRPVTPTPSPPSDSPVARTDADAPRSSRLEAAARRAARWLAQVQDFSSLGDDNVEAKKNRENDDKDGAKNGVDKTRNTGGFCFSPSPADEPKAGRDGPDGRPRSYRSATLDGWRALAAAEQLVRAAASPSAFTEFQAKHKLDERRTAARVWLARRRRQGDAVLDTEGAPVVWSESLKFYDVAAEAGLNARRIDLERESWQTPELGWLIDSQGRDGAWSNSATRMREDDPLIATSLAVVALAEST